MVVNEPCNLKRKNTELLDLAQQKLQMQLMQLSLCCVSIVVFKINDNQNLLEFQKMGPQSWLKTNKSKESITTDVCSPFSLVVTFI